MTGQNIDSWATLFKKPSVLWTLYACAILFIVVGLYSKFADASEASVAEAQPEVTIEVVQEEPSPSILEEFKAWLEKGKRYFGEEEEVAPPEPVLTPEEKAAKEMSEALEAAKAKYDAALEEATAKYSKDLSSIESEYVKSKEHLESDLSDRKHQISRDYKLAVLEIEATAVEAGVLSVKDSSGSDLK